MSCFVINFLLKYYLKTYLLLALICICRHAVDDDDENEALMVV